MSILFDFKFDMIFADPPYFLSSGGISMQSSKVVCVDKGDWDKPKSQEEMMEWNRHWLGLCREKLKDNGTIWISGTYHNIFSVANCLTELGYKILNVITWQKANPPANISCRFFTYSTEFVIWARKSKNVPHKFNYELMKHINGDKQMTDVWRLPAIGLWEKSCGKHPTQKPLRLLTRLILASTDNGDWVLTHSAEVARLELLQTFVDVVLQASSKIRNFAKWQKQDAKNLKVLRCEII